VVRISGKDLVKIFGTRSIQKGTARVIHVPFKQEPLVDAVSQFSFDSLPTSGVSYYSTDAYASFGVVVRR
jgi:hypothetical protein